MLDRDGADHELEPRAPSASRVTPPTEIIGQHFSRFYPPEAIADGDPEARTARARSVTGASRTKAGACARTARASGPTSSSPRCCDAKGNIAVSRRSRATSPNGGACGARESKPPRSTSFSRCSRTSCAIRSRRSATRVNVMQLKRRRTTPAAWARDVIDRQVDAPHAPGRRPARRQPHHQRQDRACAANASI